MPKKSFDNSLSLVVTSNDLVLAKYNFSLWQKRVFNYFVSQIDKDAREFMLQRVYVSDLIRFFNAGDGREVYDIITSVPKQLYNLSIKIPYVSEEGFQRYGEMRIITRYTKPEDREPGNAYIEFKFNDDLKPHLLELKRRFAKYDLHNIVGLQSTHSIRMFEILKSYEYQGEVKLEVEYLKTVLELGDKYKLYADFRRYVIDKAREDLDKYCDISFDYREIKKSRKVDELHFTIKRNNSAAPDIFAGMSTMDTEGVGEESATTELQSILERVQTWWGVLPQEFLKRMKGKTVNDAEAAIQFTLLKIKEGKAKNPAGIFLEALTKGFKTFQQHHTMQQTQVQQKQQKQKAELEKWQNEYEKVQDEWAAEVNNLVRTVVEKDPSVTSRAIEAVIQDFTATKREHFVKDKTVEDFRQIPMLREAVIVAIKNMFKGQFDPMERSYLHRLNVIKEKISKI
jgi:plasmid replication initiation protein